MWLKRSHSSKCELLFVVCLELPNFLVFAFTPAFVLELAAAFARLREIFEFFENPAGATGMVSRAQTLERLQFALEFFEFSNSVFDVSNVRVNRFVHDGKVAAGLILQIDESAHFLEAHVQKTAVPNEMQPRQMLVRVIAVVVFQPKRRGQ